jgi:hypothetical protein
LVELAPSIEVASTYLIHMLETRFASLNPFTQYMFLKLHKIEDPKKKAFILEALRLKFKDVIIEARKVLKHFNKLGSPIKVISTNDEGAKIPIPSKLLGLCEAFENNFDWICPQNHFSDLSEPKRDHKGASKTYLLYLYRRPPLPDFSALSRVHVTSFIFPCTPNVFTYSSPHSCARQRV